MTDGAPEDPRPGDDEGEEVERIDPASPARGVVDPDEEHPPEPGEPG